jgi:hypothetical protein
MISRVPNSVMWTNRSRIVNTYELRLCARAGGVLTLLSFLFVVLGVISDALNITLSLEPMSWFLLAIFATVHAITPVMHVVVAKHFLGIDTQGKKE